MDIGSASLLVSPSHFSRPKMMRLMNYGREREGGEPAIRSA